MSPYDHGVHHSELVFPSTCSIIPLLLDTVNNTYMISFKIIAPPQSYAIIYLLWQCNSISNDERLKRAKKDFLDRGLYDEECRYYQRL